MRFPSKTSGLLAAVMIMATTVTAHADPAKQISKAAAAGRQGSFLFTTYTADSEIVNWTTCGATPQDSGCYGSGNVGPFVRACSVAASGQNLVVADLDASSGKAMLHIYKQQETTTPSISLKRSVELPGVPVSRTATCELAVLGDFAYVGTSETDFFYQVNLKNFALTQTSGCGEKTSQITADGEIVSVSLTGCVFEFDKKGKMWGVGGGTSFVPSYTGLKIKPL